VRLVPAWLEGEEVIAVFEQATDPAPHHFMRIDWRDGRIAMIRDFRYVPYVMEGAELVLDEGA
jgi:RNA polymerase sigma-70 factor (ECF subfamily)